MAEGVLNNREHSEKTPYRPHSWKKGVRGGPGRAKGQPNRTTKMLKEALLIAANEAGGGGEDGLVKYLTACAMRYPTAFLPLLGRVLPLQIQDETGSRVEVALVRHVIIDAERVEELTDDSGAAD
jgi:hypothetical protein